MKVAVLLNNLEHRIIKKMVNGEEIEEVVPKYKGGKKFPIVNMDMFWLSPEEKGGVAAEMGAMDYIRLTFPNGEKTKNYNLFEIKDEDHK